MMSYYRLIPRRDEFDCFVGMVRMQRGDGFVYVSFNFYALMLVVMLVRLARH